MKKLNLLLAWTIHILTASGLIVGLCSIIAIVNENYSLLLRLTVIGLLIDGIDGTLARKLKVKELIPTIDGALLDNIVDYINYAFVPTVFLYNGAFLKNEHKIVACIGVLLASAYQFSRTDAKTSDDFFRGFPSLWNLLIIFNLIFDIGQTVNFTIIVMCTTLSFAPIKFVYPSKTKEFRLLTITLTVLTSFAFILTIFMKLPKAYLDTSKMLMIFYFLYLTLISLYLTYKTREK
ncbi:CDP-alcohol phosphatidyltransferase family protein [Borrelia sp. BU AG58]|uniref:CDP-alcohol phosphatidyltransferase family protein n=1 Tax=Borrelia sp. BU AG58 TaxID=2887345 RepID=UPI001E419DBB|nr:CDP-alcohol phosphatidyltransferase family protein [Borrelia sp. BU AG58]UER67440.1 CDP-alcohol phosphatidyltransferase family protein [Borrelia sp. BU AG58]